MLMEDMADADPLVKPAPDDLPVGARGCADCARLVQEARSALLAGDGSRLTDARVRRHRHVADGHSPN
ncbi:hypothetical protein GXW83_18945 [Streptacidiphilus sp. PB12-B1b]|uniref:hypothetical protein n=1 Tax=Streptacidiphilus sp. PB12-B1b TaxID=2705012 RepID=UPI0015F9C86B|nr:hypothetical protein [Streptacidiphilus sp. PB12-B1b]QMU77465.1 hypothetical protein GXW83_18945 [Streptacidiphilus sp. PB12-B1b]